MDHTVGSAIKAPSSYPLNIDFDRKNDSKTCLNRNGVKLFEIFVQKMNLNLSLNSDFIEYPNS